MNLIHDSQKNSLKEAGIIERYGSGIKPILERFSM